MQGGRVASWRGPLLLSVAGELDATCNCRHCCCTEIQKAMIEEILIALWTSTRDLAMTAVEWAREKVSGERLCPKSLQILS